MAKATAAFDADEARKMARSTDLAGLYLFEKREPQTIHLRDVERKTSV